MIQPTETTPEVEPSALTKEQIQFLRESARKSLYFFAKGILGYDWLVPHIHKPVCEMLQSHDQNRLRFVLPRGWLKSTICSISYPIWEIINNPEVRCLLVQNTHTNACKKLSEIRGHFESNELFKALFNDLLPDKNCVWKTDSLEIKRRKSHPEATFEAAGIRTALVSRHYDIIIEDDTVAPDLDEVGEMNMAPTKEDIEQAIGFHRLVTPLLVDIQQSRNVIVGTRWFEKDLISWNMENEHFYAGIERAVREDDNGEADEQGVITYPERFNENVLSQLHATLGPYMFSCLYMNKPVRSSDMVFEPDKFRFYDHPPRDLITWTTVDLATDPEEAKSEVDYNVVITCGKDLQNGNIYVLDYFRKRCNPSEVLHNLFYHVSNYHSVKVGIESVAYQKSFVYWTREMMKTEQVFFQIEPITHGKRSKNMRIMGLQPVIYAERLFFRKSHTELINELISFPYGAHDDIIDGLSLQLPMWKVTLSRKERQVKDTTNPLQFDTALSEIKSRNEKPKGSIYDVLHVNPFESSGVFN